MAREVLLDGIMLAREVLLDGIMLERLVAVIADRFPCKSFGYLVSHGDPWRAEDFVVFDDNIRNAPEWKGRFQAYGQYFIDHDDAGFVATPDESWRVQCEIWNRGMVEVGVFHSHQRHPANFSRIDYEMHLSRFEQLWHLIISMRNPALPQVRAFSVSRDGVAELPVRLADREPSRRAEAVRR
jgi:proteasome lid subunit RPN8/RPN11